MGNSLARISDVLLFMLICGMAGSCDARLLLQKFKQVALPLTLPLTLQLTLTLTQTLTLTLTLATGALLLNKSGDQPY